MRGWEAFARRLLDTPGHEVFLSGSSAKLLSRELATAMRGRAWELVLRPYSFREFLAARGERPPARPAGRQRARTDSLFAEYLRTGGFPEAQGLGAAERGLLLTSYVDVVLLRDVIERHAVTNVTALRWLARRLLASPAGTFSVSSFANDLKSQGIHAGRDLLHQYLAYLADAFLLDTVPVATDSEKRRQVNPRKVYLVDTGLIPVYDRSGKANIGHALETAVFHALQAKGAEPAYVKTETGEEVDFLARFPDGGEALVQVCASIDDARTREREVRALLAASAGHPRARKLILTLESRVPFPETPEGIQVLPAWEWLTEC